MDVFKLISSLKDELSRNLFILICLIALVCTIIFLHESPIILITIIIILSLLITSFFLFVKETINELNSKKWFEKIVSELKNSNQAVIFLRNFSHPDDAEMKHKEDILKIMQEFGRMIYEHNDDFRVIAYIPSNSNKNKPNDWLISELHSKYNMNYDDATKLINNCIKVIHTQPISNSYTLYMIDNSVLLYNYVDNNKMKYFKNNFSRSILSFLVNEGFTKLYNS